MTTRFFRAGVGTVIYNDLNLVAIFERLTHPVGVWEFQQGGIDSGEQPHDTLWRELKEEIGITEDDIETIHEMPDWTIYETSGIQEITNENRLGQAHCWFFLRLKDTSVIDLQKATEQEVSNFKWTQFEEAILQAGDHKKHVYESLHEHFKQLRRIN